MIGLLDFFKYLFEGEKNMTCIDLVKWINETLGLEDEDGYKEGKT